MGQCNLSQKQTNYFGDLFNTQESELSSTISKQNIAEKDKVMWEQQLGNSYNLQLPQTHFWSLPIALIHPCFQQISKDVTRTFPESNYFGSKNNLQKFQKILKKLALYFPKVGYTQGLNFVAGFIILSDYDEEQCFNLLVKLMINDRILAIGLYQDNFPLNKFYCEVFWLILSKKLPTLCEKLKKLNISDELWLFQWFMTLFLYNFPLEFSRHMWDFIILKKQFAPVLLAYGIIKSLKNQIISLQMQDDIDFFQYIEQLRDVNFCRKYLDLKKIFTIANSISKIDIDKVIFQTKCFDNPYRQYFASNAAQQRDIWQSNLKKLEEERAIFNCNPELNKYERSTNIIQNLQKLVLSKYKLYKSQLKRSNGSFCKRSNFSVPFSIRSCKTPNNRGEDFSKKRFL